MGARLKFVAFIFALLLGFALAFYFIGSGPRTNDLPISQFSDGADNAVPTSGGEGGSPVPARPLAAPRPSEPRSPADEALAQLAQFEQRLVAENDAKLGEGETVPSESVFSTRRPERPAQPPVSLAQIGTDVPRVPALPSLDSPDDIKVPSAMDAVQQEIARQLDEAAANSPKRPPPPPVVEPPRADTAPLPSAMPGADRRGAALEDTVPQAELRRALDTQAQKFQAEISALRAELQQARSGSVATNQLQEKLAQLQSENVQLNADLRAKSNLQNENVALRGELESALREKRSMQEQLSGDLKKSAQDREAREQAVRQVMVDLKTETQNAKKSLEEANLTITKLRGELRDAKQEAALAHTSASGAAALKQEREQLRQRVSELEQSLGASKLEIDKKKSLEIENATLKRRLDGLAGEKTALEEELKARVQVELKLKSETAKTETVLQEKANLEETINSLRGKLKTESDSALAARKELEAKNKELQAKLGEIQDLNRQVSKAIEDSRTLSGKLELSEQMAKQVPQLKSEIVRLQNTILEKQAEIQLLDKTQRHLTQAPRVGQPPAQQPQIQPTPPYGTGPVSQPPPARPQGEAVVVVVRAAKAFLRSGPGFDNSPLMDVQRGTRLTVETKEGDWMRVITPTGSRAYIQAELVADEGSPLAEVPLNIDNIPVAPKPPIRPRKNPSGGSPDPLERGMVPFDENSSEQNGSKQPEDSDDDVLRAFENLKKSMSSGQK